MGSGLGARRDISTLVVAASAFGLLAFACSTPTANERATPFAASAAASPATSTETATATPHSAPAAASSATALYAARCSACHGADRRGSEGGAPLVGDAFRARWSASGEAALAERIRLSMPPGRPESLSPASAHALAALLLATPGTAGEEIREASASERTHDVEWRFVGGDAGSQRYSPLDQIDRDNVAKLAIAWRWRADNFGPSPETNYRTTPLMVGRTLYATAGSRRAVVAIDAASGETLWVHREDEGARAAAAPRSNSGRGVAYWSDGREERIFVITPGFRLVALDAREGRPIESFGESGRVDLKRGLDRELDPETAPIGSTSPPIVVGDVVVVGSALADGSRPPALAMPPGHVRGYDVRTGAQRWIFHTLPHPGEPGHETWPADAWKTMGNTAVWTTMSADLERGLVYLPVEAATGDFWGGHRPGDNHFSQSLVCLDARTGRRVWSFQTVHHDVWDYDLPAAPILVDVLHDGVLVPAVAQLTKQGFTFVFDRRTGEPLWPIEERPVPASDVPGERLSPTQPFPTKPPPFERQGLSEADLIDFTPALRDEARAIFRRYRSGPLFTPGSRPEPNGTKGTLILPGTVGGANWPGGAVDPETGTLYVGSSTSPSVLRLGSDPALSPLPYVLLGYPLPDELPGGSLPLVKPPWGRITAIDLDRGALLFTIANGDVHPSVRAHPALAGVELPRTGRPDRAGLLVTKTLLFAGEGGGMYGLPGGGGPMLRAHDKTTGEILAELALPANQTGLPISYAIDGKQFIVVAVGAPDHPGELVALALP
ncbi:MAG: pyrroloquinoline quinone-dependent dehydrogenase [Deltaproteobacteria bacterium]|nr:pyrroloquinoline quinone-dependent dehydrogenase [Deltaproteobacteria bacterium]